MRYGEKGDHVKRLQEQLIGRGFALPQYGADGSFGEETWDALQAFARSVGTVWAPEVPRTVLDQLPRRQLVAAPLAKLPDVGDLPKVLDLTKEQSNPPVYRDGKPHTKFGRDGKVLRRAPGTIRGIVLHQTAVEFGATEAAKKKLGEKEAIYRRALGVAAHMTVFKDGTPVLACPLDWYVWHGNGFNVESYGLEVEGLFAGLMDPKKPQLSKEQLAGCKAGLRYLVEEGRAAGNPIEFIWAHRQSSDTRLADPSQELWQEVALDFGVGVLGLKTEPGRTVGSGYPIPKEWDAAGVGSYKR